MAVIKLDAREELWAKLTEIANDAKMLRALAQNDIELTWQDLSVWLGECDSIISRLVEVKRAVSDVQYEHRDEFI